MAAMANVQDTFEYLSSDASDSSLDENDYNDCDDRDYDDYTDEEEEEDEEYLDAEEDGDGETGSAAGGQSPSRSKKQAAGGEDPVLVNATAHAKFFDCQGRRIPRREADFLAMVTTFERGHGITGGLSRASSKFSVTCVKGKGTFALNKSTKSAAPGVPGADDGNGPSQEGMNSTSLEKSDFLPSWALMESEGGHVQSIDDLDADAPCADCRSWLSVVCGGVAQDIAKSPVAVVTRIIFAVGLLLFVAGALLLLFKARAEIRAFAANPYAQTK